MNEAVRHLLADFEEAFRVYERLSANAERRAGNEPAAPVKIETLPWAGDSDGLLSLVDGEALVLGCAVERDEVAQEALQQLEQAHAAGRLASGARVYAIVVTGSWELTATDPTFYALWEFCAARDLVWSGGLAVGGGALVAAQAGEARMGRRRRARSEGIDQLIMAVRTGVGVGGLPGASGDIIDAPCSMPRFIYRRKFPEPEG